MKSFRSRTMLLVIGLIVIALTAFIFLTRKAPVDFNADVKPILNKKCIACHGGVKKQGGFSVLFREEALAITKSGKPAIIPGNPNGSEMIRRITLNDPEERMPYKHDPLSKQEISVLKRWIKQGAKWGDHWAYVPVKQEEMPDVENAWIKNDIDKFIYTKLEEKKLTPSGRADKAVLLRRASLDLIGMLPSTSLAKQYLHHPDSSKAYEILIDSLLASPHFGERWAAVWLDLARYADTKGYESDYGRTIWHYRDWVIKAFNEDKPYDEFITEQIAGDLLPNPTDAQYIATGFHRNTMNNDEGGTDNEEFRTAAVIDRVNTTWESLMSTTFSCVQCHSHPYDPFKHEEYYKFLAYFNNTRDEDVEGEYPVLKNYNDTLQQQLAEVTAWVKQHASDNEANATNVFLRTGQPAINSTTAQPIANSVISNNSIALVFRNNAVAKLKKVNLEGVNQLIYNYYSNKKNGVLTLRLDSANGPMLARFPMPAKKESRQIVAIDFPEQKGVHDIYLSYQNPSLAKKPEEVVIYFDWFHFGKQFPGKDKEGYATQEKSFWQLLNANPVTTPIMVENPGSMWRQTNVFERGNWATKGAEVQPEVPHLLNFAMPSNAPKNRMGLALWLTDKKNPLVSRTIVNRLWEQLFGTGIVETLEDMGTQGLSPTHKELLDHLAWKLMTDYKWSLKTLLKEMMMSATYQQDSRLTEEGKEKDLFNRYYARGPRVRLSAEQLRDQHLTISGSLCTKMYGPSVMPWQPDGIWQSPYNSARWESSKGEDQYRRAIYTYWKRGSPYPSMITFDGAMRVVCNARRIRTNTPLQALVTLNDSTYLNMARDFAFRLQKEKVNNVPQQISHGYEIMLYKKIPDAKLKIFLNLYDKALVEFKKDADRTCEMTGMNDEHNNPETAALVVVANAMLNLDEVVMKN